MERAQLHRMFRPAETSMESMEFLSRSWSVSAFELTKVLAPSPPPKLPPKGNLKNSVIRGGVGEAILEDASDELEAASATVSGNPFSFASSKTSQLVMECIMSHSQDVSPRISGRLSNSSDLLNGGQSCGSLTDSPLASPSEIDDPKISQWSIPVSNQYKVCAASGSATSGGGKTVGRWLKNRRERKKEEARVQNAQLHATVSVAGVAAAVAAIAAATAASSRAGKDEQMAKIDMAVASAATLVAAQCVEAAELMGAERERLASVVSSAVNVRSAGDIMTLMAAAATALRGAATLKARAMKELWNVASVIPVDKGMRVTDGGSNNGSSNDGFIGELVPEENFLGICSRELLAKGCELLKRTRKGDLHWKIVSVYINQMGQVMLKMKSRHVVGTITKKKKNVILEVLKDIPPWVGRHILEGSEHRRYFGLKTVTRGVVEFECRNQREYDIWTRGVSRLLAITAEKNNRHKI